MAGGKSEILFSGYVTGNSYEYRPFEVRGYAQTAIVVDVVTAQSNQGVTYTVRGYPNRLGPVASPAIGYKRTLKVGTALLSGDCHYLTVSDPYDTIDVGVKNTVSNISGVITVMANGKRRT